jgi:predicted ATPase
MLKKLTIRNFKAIQDMTIEFTPLTVLIGENGCGKSTILQALDFLYSFSSRDIPEYLREKEWDFEKLKSQCNGDISRPIEFITTWNLLVKDCIETVEWTLSVDFNKGWIIKEKIINLSYNSPRPVLSYHVDGQSDFPPSLGQINIQSSALKYVAGTSNNAYEIDILFYMLSDSTCFGLLSPEKIRSGNKPPNTHNIGESGESLAYFINKMDKSERQQLNKIVSDLMGSRIAIQTIDLGNKIELSIIFETAENTMTIDSLHISDGLLRIITFAVISMVENVIYIGTEDGTRLMTESGEYIVACKNTVNNGMILLDEIENGINPYMTEQIVSLLRDINEKKKRQIIVTTHSPVILNGFKQEEIIFLWKDKNNSVHSRKFFETNEMKSLLEALSPGEVWINLEKEDILERLSFKKEGK